MIWVVVDYYLDKPNISANIFFKITKKNSQQPYLAVIHCSTRIIKVANFNS